MTKSINYRGSLLYFQDNGTGSPVILLHGFGESGSIWNEQVIFLTPYFRIIVPDLPGSGASKMPETGEQFLTMDDYADAIKMILEQENIKTCTLIGHSMGGYITLAFAEKYPESRMDLAFFIQRPWQTAKRKRHPGKKGLLS